MGDGAPSPAGSAALATEEYRSGHPSDEAGSGAIATLVGVLVVWSVLAVGVHVLLGIWAGSRVSVAADDAVRIAALADDHAQGRSAAEAMLRQRFEQRLRGVSWSNSNGRVLVTVTVDGPSLLPEDAPFSSITRHAGRRVEVAP